MRRPRSPAATAQRYTAAKFNTPGHRHSQKLRRRARALGHTVAIDVQDDHTRLVYAELHSAEHGAKVSIALRHAAAWFLEQRCRPREAVMSDNARCYSRSHAFRDTLAD